LRGILAGAAGKDGGTYRENSWCTILEEYWPEQRVKMEEPTRGRAGKFLEEYWRQKRVRFEELIGEELLSFERNASRNSIQRIRIRNS
jgi:hypothetical protein